MRRAAEFLRRDVWRRRSSQIPRRQGLWLRPLRVLLLAARRFRDDQGQLRASALTFYTLLSIVPVLAVTFAFAKAFGIEQRFEAVVTSRLQGHEEIAAQILSFARTQLDRTQGGLVAGFGVLLLLWSALKLFTHVERAFNAVWGTRELRPLGRRLLDYVGMTVLLPVLLVVNSSVAVQLVRHIDFFAERLPVLDGASAVLAALPPVFGMAVLLAILYRHLPNANVSLRAAVVGSCVAAILYHLTQWAYLSFQFWMAGFNAVYGSFAALPLFLLWVQLSWMIFLFGVELSSAMDHEVSYEFAQASAGASPRLRRLLALRVTALCAMRFRRGFAPPPADEIIAELGIPVRLAQRTLHDLQRAGILICVRDAGRKEAYRPGVPLDRLTVHTVLASLDQTGSSDPVLTAGAGLEGAESILSELDEVVSTSDANIRLVDLEARRPTRQASTPASSSSSRTAFPDISSCSTR